MELFNTKLNSFNKLSLLLFSLLPISLIIGNAGININIWLINLIFLIYCLKFNFWTWLKKDIFLYFLVLYIFLILNSSYSYFILFEDQTKPFYNDDSILRSLSFIKFILLVFAFSVLLKSNKILSLLHFNWLLIITIIILDIFFEKFTGRNILGNISPDQSRIVSFFKDELVVGGLIFCFGYTSTLYFVNRKIKNKSITPIILIFLLVPLSIFVTGEKSNFIKSILLFFIIIYFFKLYKQNLNYKIILIIEIFLISCFFIFSETTHHKYKEIYKRILVQDGKYTLSIMHDDSSPSKEIVSTSEKKNKVHKQLMTNFANIKYFAHYDAAIRIFKNYPISGIGGKNFRIECSKEKYYNEKIAFSHNRCSTHPHQVHLEILSEQGILGYLLILGLVLWISIRTIKMSIKNKNVYYLGNVFYVLIFFIPLLPSGGIFSTFNGTLFWVIFSLVNLNYEKK